MPVVTTLEIQKRNKDRVNVYLDDDYAFSLDIMAAAHLHKGQQLSDEEIDELQNQDEVTRGVDRAVRFLSYRPRSINEIRRNLADKQTPEAVIDAAIERLNHMGYVDDKAFATFWVENRNQFKPLSQRALRYELRRKGVVDEDIEAALGDLDETEAACRAARSRIRRHRGKSRKVFRHKLGAFLQRRGFGYDVIQPVVEQLIEEIDTENTDYFDVTGEE